MVIGSSESKKKYCLNLEITGEITWKSVQEIMTKKTVELEEFVANFQSTPLPDLVEIQIDLSEVTKVDMCALALILEIERKIQSLSKSFSRLNLIWLNAPSDIISLANLCGLTQDMEFK